MRKWIQTWANYYSHITRNSTDVETHDILSKERDTQHKIIIRAEEHLRGVHLFYEQSSLTDPHPPGKIKKGPNSHSDGHSDTIVSETSQNTSKPAEELSDRKI